MDGAGQPCIHDAVTYSQGADAVDSTPVPWGRQRTNDRHACAPEAAWLFFFFHDTATTEIYTLSLHDALPICWRSTGCSRSQPTARSSRLRQSQQQDRKSTRLNSSHTVSSYAVFCLKKKN